MTTSKHSQMNLDEFKNEKKYIAIFGAARSGLSAACTLSVMGARVVLWDDNSKARQLAAKSHPDLVFRNLHENGAWDKVGLLLVSPGISHNYPYQNDVISSAYAAGVPVDNDIGLFFRTLVKNDNALKTIGITGSNGKSTTTKLVHFLLSNISSSNKVHMGGNIGKGVFEISLDGNGDEFIVLELSSYQTELASSMDVDIGVFTNFSLDHLDRHNGVGGYFAAKRRLFDLSKCKNAVIGINEPEGRFLANNLLITKNNVICVSEDGPYDNSKWNVFSRGNVIHEIKDGVKVFDMFCGDIKTLRGSHNMQNICTAYSVCRILGFPPEEIAKLIPYFPGIEHRLEFVGEKNGIKVVNDSKATNIESTIKAIEAWENIHLILGGQAKEGSDFTALNPLMNKVSAVYSIGSSMEYIYSLIKHERKEICETVRHAFDCAVSKAKPGDVIMLSPACASFDQYVDFEDRGRDFKAHATSWLDSPSLNFNEV